MVFQHFMLADNLTALENVVLGAEKLHGIGDDARDGVPRHLRPLRLRPATPTCSSRSSASPTGSASRSSRSSSAARKVIILDEPTAVLVPQEVDALFENLRDLRAHGHSVLFISHKLDEVLAIADDITVMRRGTTVG